MKLSLDLEPLHRRETPCVVIGITENGELSPSAAAIDQAAKGALRRLIESHDVNPALAKTTFLPAFPGLVAQRVLAVGFGKREKLDRARFDQACFAAGRALRNHVLTEALVCLHDVTFGTASAGWRLRQAALAMQRANYRYTVTKPIKEDSPVPLKAMAFHAEPRLQTALDQAAALAAGFNQASELGDLPPNICNPAYLATEAGRIAAEHEQVELEVLGESEMAELGMDALLGVARGSVNPPRLIVLKYRGAEANEQPVVLVGKGITFDSGGLSLKTHDNMTQMKYDMCGAAAVMGAFLACARLRLRINLVTVVAAAENMPDGNAYRPGDVVTSMSGRTIEVLNTDAEGRLALCDALTYSERFNPRAVIDVATLTGACVIALGHHASGLMSNDDQLASDLLAAGDDVVDRAWRLPLWDDYQSQIDSAFADLQNVGGMPAGAVTAACFLARFTEGQRWAHLDIAGSAWKWKSTDGATGRPVGLLTRYLMQVAGLEAI